MTVKEMMLKLLAEDANDIDFCDDYDERAYIAYCGNHWSPKAEEKYAEGFALTVDEKYSRLTGDDRIVIVHCENAKQANALNRLLASMAGYLEGEEEYNELYPEPEIKEDPVPERAILEVVLTDGRVLKATQVEVMTLWKQEGKYMFDGHKELGFAVYEANGECNPYYINEVVRIIGEEKT